MVQTSGRHDQSVPLFSARERAMAFLALMGAMVVAAWHAATVLTAGVAWGRVGSSLGVATKGDVGAGTVAVFALVVGQELALLYALLRVKAKVFRRRRGGKGFADKKTMRARFGAQRAKERSFDKGMPLRPGLDRSVKDVSEFGLELGTELNSGSEVVIPFDDHVSVTAPTGGGKSARVMIAAAQSAPGALVVTTNEATILDAIVAARTPKGRIWVFDPLGRTQWAEPMVWDAVAGCEDGERATARAGAFCMGVKSATTRSSGNEAFFTDTARTAMEAMLHAAALDGRGMGSVLTWALQMGDTVETPRNIITDSTSPYAEPLWPQALAGVAQGAADTVASTRTTLQRQIKPLLRRSVLRWVDPQAAREYVQEHRRRVEETGGDSSRIMDPVVFDPYAFVGSTDTLVLVSDENAPSDVSPLCSMVFQEVMDAVKRLAPLSEYQRIEPPLRVVGDEIANVAPIPKLPAMTTEVRKLGVQLILAFQDDLQATSRWGDADGMKMLNQMGVEIILPGVKSESTLKRFSGMTGTVEVVHRSDTVDTLTGHRSSSGLSTQERAAMRPDEIRMMPDGQALAIYRNVEPFLITMPPWWERKGGAALSAAAKDEARARAARARQAWADEEALRARHVRTAAETA